MSMRVVIRTRRDTAAEWMSVNPVLSLGEMGIETDTRKIKFGDGTTSWNSLSYISAGSAGEVVAEDIDDRISELLVAGEGISLVYDDEANTLTISSSGGIVDGDKGDITVSGDGIIWTIDNLAITNSKIANNAVSNAKLADMSNNTIKGRVSSGTGDPEDLTAEQVLTILGISDGGISNIVEDTTPQLGGDLDLNNNDIVGTGNINLLGNITANTGNLDVISFNINDESALTKGQLSWDDTEGTLSLGLTDNSTIHFGEHRYFRVRNETGDILYKGQVVYATGVHSNGIITPSKYIADGTIREVRFMGIVLENINNNNNGYVIDFGNLHDMDLDGSATNYAVGDETWNAGDILYVHPTVAGKLTKNEPKHSISVAIVLDPGNGNGNGRMFVRPTSYGHLDDNHDVNISGVTNGQYLQYNSATDYWIPTSSGTFISLDVNGIADFSSTIDAPNLGVGEDNSVVVLDSDGKLRTDEIDSRVWGSSLVDGNGTANYIAKWNDSNTLTSSTIYDDGTNIGIGTFSPNGKFNVVGGRTFLEANNEQYSLGVKYINTGGAVYFGAASSSLTPDAVISNAGGAELTRFTTSGNVGIGTSSPSYKLDVAGSGNFTNGVYVNGAPVIQSNVTGITGASSINNIVAISQSDYNNLPSYDSNTIYIING